MRNEENIGHIVLDKRAITGLSLACKIYSLLIHHLLREAKKQVRITD